MFIRYPIGEVSLPREKPIRVVLGTRPMTYVNWVEDEAVTTYGQEIAREVNMKGKPPLLGISTDYLHMVAAQAQGRFDHAKKCKHSPDECLHCQSNIAWFSELPLAALSFITEEKRTR